jgi:hypothetical protein
MPTRVAVGAKVHEVVTLEPAGLADALGDDMMEVVR